MEYTSIFISAQLLLDILSCFQLLPITSRLYTWILTHISILNEDVFNFTSSTNLFSYQCVLEFLMFISHANTCRWQTLWFLSMANMKECFIEVTFYKILGFWISSFSKWLYRALVHISLGLYIFSLWICELFLYFFISVCRRCLSSVCDVSFFILHCLLLNRTTTLK